MSGAAIEITLEGVERLNQRFATLAHIDTDNQFLNDVGGVVESQTHRRIRTEKTSPDGIAWPEWSDEYAETRHGGHSLLMGEGNLDDSIQFSVGVDSIEVGTNVVYAAEHQFGNDQKDKAGRKHNTPAREYLGMNDDNWAEVEAVLDARIDEIMGLS